MTSGRSGLCRRIEGYVSTVLVAGANHETFDVRVVSVERRPELHERLQVTELPALLVVDGDRVVARADGVRSKDEVGLLLAPWLKGGFRTRAGVVVGDTDAARS